MNVGFIFVLIVMLFVIGLFDVMNGYVLWLIFNIIFCVFLKSIFLFVINVLFKIFDVFVINFFKCWFVV